MTEAIQFPLVIPDWQMEKMAERGAIEIQVSALLPVPFEKAYFLAYRVLEAAGFVAECNASSSETPHV